MKENETAYITVVLDGHPVAVFEVQLPLVKGQKHLLTVGTGGVCEVRVVKPTLNKTSRKTRRVKVMRA